MFIWAVREWEHLHDLPCEDPAYDNEPLAESWVGLTIISVQFNQLDPDSRKPASATFKALRFQASWSGFEDLRAESEPAGGGQGW